MRCFFICTLLLLNSLACMHAKNSVRISERENIIQNEKALDSFVKWHNEFFSGSLRPITYKELSEFFADDIYFEVNGKMVAHSIDQMIRDYDRIKNKGYKRVDIEKFDEKTIEPIGDGAIKITVKHDATMVFKDDSKKVFKVESEILIKSGKIYKYIEKFGI